MWFFPSRFFVGCDQHLFPWFISLTCITTTPALWSLYWSCIVRLQNGSCVTSHHQRVERFTRLPLHSFERTLHIRWGIGNQCVTNPKIWYFFLYQYFSRPIPIPFLRYQKISKPMPIYKKIEKFWNREVSKPKCHICWKPNSTFRVVYLRSQAGRKVVDKEAEEEQYRDLTLLMELLTNLLSKDFIDLSPADSGETPEEVVSGVLWSNILSPFFSGSNCCGRVSLRVEHHHASYVCWIAQISQPVPSGLQFILIESN